MSEAATVELLQASPEQSFNGVIIRAKVQFNRAKEARDIKQFVEVVFRRLSIGYVQCIGLLVVSVCLYCPPIILRQSLSPWIFFKWLNRYRSLRTLISEKYCRTCQNWQIVGGESMDGGLVTNWWWMQANHTLMLWQSLRFVYFLSLREKARDLCGAHPDYDKKTITHEKD